MDTKGKYKCMNIMELLEKLKDDPKDIFYLSDEPKYRLRNAYFWSDFAYDRYTDIHSISEHIFKKNTIAYKLDILKYYKESPFCFVVTDDKHKKIIISSRGAGKKRDMFSLNQYRDASKRYYPIIKGLNKTDFEKVFDEVHTGIVNHAHILLSMIYPVIQSKKHYEIYIHGHSLGAACGIIIGHYLTLLGYGKVNVRVLACPPVFKEKFKNDSIKYTHWYSQEDPFFIYIKKLFSLWELFRKDTNDNIELPCAEMLLKTPFFMRQVIRHAVFKDPNTHTIYTRDSLKQYLEECEGYNQKEVIRSKHIDSYVKLKKQKLKIQFEDRNDKEYSHYSVTYD